MESGKDPRNLHRCHFCDYGTKSLFIILKHIRQHRKKLKGHLNMFACHNNRPKAYKCEECDFTSNLKVSLKRHLIQNHKEDQKQSINVLRQCEFCDFQTYSILVLMKHSVKCEDLRCKFINWLECEHCSYVTRKEYCLLNHLKHQHSTKLPLLFQCEKCPFKTKWKICLRQHVNMRHTNLKNVKWFKCDKCLFKSKWKECLQRHKLVKHTNNNKSLLEGASEAYVEKNIPNVYIILHPVKHTTNSNTTTNPVDSRGHIKNIQTFPTNNCIINMVNLLRIKFKTLPLADKINIKNIGRPTPSLNLHQHGKAGHRNFTRRFSDTTYEKFKWMCGCDTVNALYCFPCVLFHSDERDRVWSVTGFTDLKHLNERAKKHETSSQHFKCCMDLALLGSVDIASQLNSAYRQHITQHNEQVSKNRYILKRIINCIKFCGKLEIALRGHNERDDSENRGVFRELIDFSSELDSVLKEHLSNATVFKGTSKTIIQNEIIDSMLAVCRQEIKNQINASDFLAIQSDEITDVSNYSQAVIIVRYLFNNNIYERFWSFLRVTDKSPAGITKVIEDELNTLIPNSPYKLIAQTYDGANVMSGVQAKIKNTYKCAHFVHSYAHQLNLIIQKATSQNSKVRVFFSTLSGVADFFSSSTHRCDILQEIVSRRLPGASPTLWNYNTQLVNFVFENREKIIECFQELAEKCNRAETLIEALCLMKIMEDSDFLFWLTLFHRILPHIDSIFDKFQNRNISSFKMLKELELFERIVLGIRQSTDAIDKAIAATHPQNNNKRNSKTRNSVIAKEVCDTIIVQLKERLTFRGHLEASNLVDSHNFLQYSLNFPTLTLLSITGHYPILKPDRLRTELEAIYSRKELSKIEGGLNMLSWLSKHDLNETFVETVKLLKIVVTTPMSTDEPERCFSTLERIKTFLKNSMNEDRLNALAMLSVNKDLMHHINNFDEKVVDHFISVKDNKHDFAYIE